MKPTILNRGGLNQPSDSIPGLQRNRPSFQPDEGSIGALRRNFRGNMESLKDVIKILDNNNLPPQLRQTPYIATLKHDTDVALLFPTNPNRMSFVMAYLDSELAAGSLIFFTYGPPPFPQIGIPLLSAIPYAEGNGTISIDDIYVSGAGTLGQYTNYPVSVLGYEGVLAIESHLHRNTSDAT